MQKEAIIYCRVSSAQQARDGHGIDGQERSCRTYAKTRGYKIAKVYKDEGISGGIIDRPGMQELLDYLERRKNKNDAVVIIDDLKRFARDVVGHFQLKSLMVSRGASLESPSHTFEDTAEGKFVETMLAATAELERNQNKRQVKNRMRARLESGYWTFDLPPGYRYEKVPGHGKLLVPDEEKASIVKEALEGFAQGRFQSQEDVREFLVSKDFTHRGKPGVVHLEQVKRLLRRILYAGYLEYPKWEVTRRKGHHKALISLDTYERIQERLNGRIMKHRKDLHKDFPLRGFVLCAHCKKPFTASWNKGRKERYPYYRCITKECSCCNKGIRKEKIESEFEIILKNLKPRGNIIKVIEHELLALWNDRVFDIETIRKRREEKIREIEEEIERYVDKIDKSNNETVIRSFEKKIDELEAKLLRYGEKIEEPKEHDYDFETALKHVLEFIKEPFLMWKMGDLAQKRLVLRMVFDEPLVYSHKNGFYTATFSLPVNVSCIPELDAMEVVEMPGIEPGSNVYYWSFYHCSFSRLPHSS